MESDAANLPLTGSSAFNLHGFIQVISRRRWLVTLTLLVVFATVALHTLRQQKVYSASTSLIIEATAPRVLDAQVGEVSEQGSGYWYGKEYAETQFKVITSRAVSARVVEKLGLDRDPKFLGLDAVKDSKRRDEIMKSIDAVAILQGKISVSPIRDSRIVRIIVEDSDPQRAALLANEVADAYIAENLALKLRISESADRWLEDRLAELESKSKASELAVYDFKKDADMLTTSLEDRASMVSQRLTSYNGALTDVPNKNRGAPGSR